MGRVSHLQFTQKSKWVYTDVPTLIHYKADHSRLFPLLICNFPPKLLKLIKQKSCRIYKVHIQKSGAFLYTNSELSEKKKLRKQSHLKLCQKEFKNLGINFIKKKKDLYTKSYDIDERNWKHTKKWNDIPHLYIGSINRTMSMLPKASIDSI